MEPVTERGAKLAARYAALVGTDAAKHKDQLPGGLADKKKPSDFDKAQLDKGTAVEVEHVDDRSKAQEIAMDHLTEDPVYYDKLEKIEKNASDAHKKSVALMKWLSGAAKAMGPKVAENVYVVGGAVRDFVLDRPIKDVDVVVDSEALGGKKNAEWFAKQIERRIPAQVSTVTNQYLVEILTVAGSWNLEGLEMKGEVIEIANTRSESYSEGGWKPESVAPTDILTDISRRELTYNTLLLRLIDLANGPDKKDIIDLTGCGLKDLEEGRMQCPSSPDEVFKDDPTRMIRVIKFALRYGHQLTPDTRAAILRNSSKLKNVPPSHLSQMLAQIILTDANWKKALVMMEDLNLLEPVKEILLSDKSFRAAIQNHVNSAKMDMMFGMMDVGLPLGAKVQFLDAAEQTRLREITLGMERDAAWEFLGKLKNAGNAVGDKSFQPGLEQEYGITKQQKGKFFPLVAQVTKELLLGDPSLADNTAQLKRLISEGVAQAMRTTRFAYEELMTISEEWGRSVTGSTWTGLPARTSGSISPIKNFMKRQRTWFEIDGDEDDFLSYITRENGDVGEERPGRADIMEARRLKNLLGEEFPDFRVEVEVVDEWTEVHVSPKRGLRATRTAAQTGDGTGVGLFFPLPEDLAKQFPKKEEDSSPAHITFLYLGEVPKDATQDLLTALERAFSEVDAPVRAVLNGMDHFMNQDAKVVFSRIRFNKDLSAIREQIWKSLEDSGFEVADSHPRYNPHTTIAYLGHDENLKMIAPAGSWDIDSVEVWGLPKKYTIPFGEKVIVKDPVLEHGQVRMARIEAKRAAASRLRERWG